MREAILQALKDRIREIAAEAPIRTTDIVTTEIEGKTFYELTITASLSDDDLSNTYGLWDS